MTTFPGGTGASHSCKIFLPPFYEGSVLPPAPPGFVGPKYHDIGNTAFDFAIRDYKKAGIDFEGTANMKGWRETMS